MQKEELRQTINSFKKPGFMMIHKRNEVYYSTQRCNAKFKKYKQTKASINKGFLIMHKKKESGIKAKKYTMRTCPPPKKKTNTDLNDESRPELHIFV